MSMFDPIERAVDEGAHHGEGHFAYLNRSGRPSFEAIRQKLDELVARYPEGHQRSLINRIRSDDDIAHDSAVFELLLYEGLRCADCVVEDIEPALPRTDRSPDFPVRTVSGERFYLEATLATGLSDKDRRAKRLADAAIHAVNSVRSEDYWLEANFGGTPNQPLRVGRLRRSIEHWLLDLDYDEVSRLWANEGAREQRPTFRHEEFGLTIILRPIPKTVREDIGRAIGVQSGDVWSRTVGGALRQSLESKAGRYGDLELPYVIAVNGLDRNGEEHDVMAALLGQDVYRYRRGPDGIANGAWDRTWDGLWITPDRGPRRQGVSGVLVFSDLSLWASTSRHGLYVGNPWARRPLTSFPLRVDKLTPRDGEFVREAGNPFSQILGWDDDWLDGD